MPLQITENLFIGHLKQVSESNLKNSKISNLIIAEKTEENVDFGNSVKITLADTENLSNDLLQAFDGGRSLIVCNQGRTHSPIAAIWHLVVADRTDIAEAEKRVTSIKTHTVIGQKHRDLLRKSVEIAMK